MRAFLTFTFGIFLTTGEPTLAMPFNCNQPRPEMAGVHNMVLFGTQDSGLYAYHLPLFAGDTNGNSGHVLMHVYQGLWRVSLDPQSLALYTKKFNIEKSENKPIPFFSFSPRGKKFKVPEMICDDQFQTEALVVFGHVESNPNFPSPEPLSGELSLISKAETLFARRFDQSTKSELTYILFGESPHFYLAHYLTDDEDSFDQIVAVENLEDDLKSEVTKRKLMLVALKESDNPNLVLVNSKGQSKSLNNMYQIPKAKGETLNIHWNNNSKTSKLKTVSEIYYNRNSDLQK